jgi:hypothetical protein
MTPPTSEHIGVVAYIEHALELLPEDPTQASVDDLGRLAAISEGLTRHTLALRANMAALARRAIDVDQDAAELKASADRRHELEAQHERALRADQRFDAYVNQAMAAHGFTPDRLLAGD